MKPPASGRRRVALYVSERSEYSQRVREGALRFLADRTGFTLRDFQDDLTRPGRAPQLLSQDPPWAGWDPDGVVALLPHDPASVPWALRAGVPVVSLGIDFRDAVPTVHVSPESIGQLAADHLLAGGYEQFGFVGIRNLVAVDQRRRCFGEVLAGRGYAVAHHELETNPWPGLYELEERAASEPGLVRFLLDAPKPIGILATSDYVGRAVCLACQRLGLSVPREVGVLGVDNYAVARTCLPPLSSIQAPGEAVGYESMALLARLMAGEAGGTRVAVPATKLVARQSTGTGDEVESEVVRAMTLIRERACDGIGVEAILDELTVSRSTLERQFLKRVGRTPGQELLRVRMDRAKELLRNTDLPVSRVAAMTGYERSSSFSDFFRKHAGTSPRAYRTGGLVGARAAARA